jgi:hypothetical protein
MTAVTAWIAGHRKLLVAIIGAGLTLAIQYWGTGNLWVSFAILAASSLGVYQVPNAPPRPAPDADTRPGGTATPKMS